MKTRKLIFAGTIWSALALAGCSSNVTPATDMPVVVPTATAPLVAEPKKVETKSVETKSVQPKSVPRKGVPRKSVPIVWRSDYEAAVKEAVKTRKPLMVDFYTDWCGACKLMDAEAYTDADIREQAQKFVMVKIDAEKRTDLAKRFEVTGYPTILWLDGDAKVLESSPGYDGVPMLKDQMKSALANFEPTV